MGSIEDIAIYQETLGDYSAATGGITNLAKSEGSTSLAQWFNKYHARLEVMGSILMGDFHI